MALNNPARGGYTSAGAPVAGTDAVDTLTIGGTPTAGTFRLSHEGFTSADIAWDAVNATLLANIDAALEALPSIGAGGITTAAGTLTAGIGTLTLTHAGNTGKRAEVGIIGVATNALTGTAPTLASARTTPGVDATGRGAPKGATLTRLDTGVLYINTGTPVAPTWTVVGSQT